MFIMSPKIQISAPLVFMAIQPRTSFQQFKSDPSRFIAKRLYGHWQRITSTPTTVPSITSAADAVGESSALISLVCISDTHNSTPSGIPNGDILLHAGDLTNKGTFAELQAQLDWINTLPHPHKVVIGGNHDLILDEEFTTNHPHRIGIDRRRGLEWGSITYLNDSSATITIRKRSLAIFGSPLTPECGTFAFQYLPIRDVWKGRVPSGTDVVLTHGPPRGHLDLGGKGCGSLLHELWRAKPRVVVCGHIHQGRGAEVLAWDSIQEGYDFPSALTVVAMVLALGWRWVWRGRVGGTVLVNAAVGEDGEIARVVYV